MKVLLRNLCPPMVWNALQSIRTAMPSISLPNNKHERDSTHQDLDVYWDPKMTQLLETWGEGNVWNEIQLLLANCHGRVLDIACGTGKTMSLLSHFQGIEVFGCDISDVLICKALERGILRDRLIVTDATDMSYSDGYFAHAYSIGSLEHFTEDGIHKFLSECYRVATGTTFHMIPISRSGRNEGWIKTFQSFHNNSADWWRDKYRAVYPRVTVLDSIWSDSISVGRWFICEKLSD